VRGDHLLRDGPDRWNALRILSIVACALATLSMLVGLAAGPVLLSAGSPPAVGAVVRALEYRSELILDIQLRFTTYRQYGATGEMAGVKEKVESVWALKGAKEYLAVTRWNQDGLGDVGVAAYDGTRCMTWHPYVGDGAGPGHGEIMPNRAVMLDGDLTPKRLTLEINGQPLTKVLRNGVPRIDGYEAVGALACVVVRDDGRGLGYKAWFAIERGFAPLRIEVFTGDPRDAVARYESYDLKEIYPGLWFPLRGVFYGRGGYVEELRIEEASIKVNDALDDGTFVLKWPTGTKIWDEIANVGYRVGDVPHAPGHLDGDQIESFLQAATGRIQRAPEPSRSDKPSTGRIAWPEANYIGFGVLVLGAMVAISILLIARTRTGTHRH